MNRGAVGTSRNVRLAALLSSCMIVTCFPSSGAVACLMQSLTQIPLFDDIPANVDPPVILQITVTGLSESSWKPEWDPPYGKRRSFNVLARVDQVLKGTVDGGDIRIAVPPASCDSPLGLGDSGIVIGTPRVHESGMIELRVISETIYDRAKRQHLKK